MHLQKIDIQGFGKLQGFACDFHPRLNLVFGANEAGKSTLQQAILYFLFGFHQSTRATKKDNSLLKRFSPWGGDRYGGQISYQLADGRSFQVVRVFAEEGSEAEVFDALTGKPLTDQFLTGRHGHLALQKDHLGLERDLFEATAFVHQAQVREILGSDNLMDSVVGIMDSGSMETSARDALNFLKKQISDIGSDRATKKELPRLRQRLDKLKLEFENQQAVRETLKERIRRMSQLEAQLDKERNRRIELNYLILTRMIDDTEKQLSKLTGYGKELSKVDHSIADLSDAATFPDELREAVTRRKLNQKNYDEQIREKQQIIHESTQELEEMERHLRPLGRYDSLQNLMPFAEYQSLSSQWIRRNAEANSAKEILDKEELQLLQQGIDLDMLKALQDLQPAEIERMTQVEGRRNHMAAEAERLAAMAGLLEHQTWARKWTRTAIIVAVPGLSLAMLLVAYFAQLAAGYPLAAAILGLGAGLYRLYVNARRKIAEQADALDAEIEAAQNRLDDLDRELQSFYQRFGVDSLGMLATRQMQHKRFLQLTDQLNRAVEEKEKLDFQLLKYLQTIDVGQIAPQDLERIGHEYGQYNEMVQRVQHLRQRSQQLGKELESVTGRMEDNRSSLVELLSQANLDTTDLSEALEAFDEGHRRRKQLEALHREKEKHTSAIDGILTTQSESELQEELKTLLTRREELLVRYPGMAAKSSNRTLPVLRDEYEAVDTRRQALEQELSACKSAIETGLEQQRPQAEIEEEMAEAQAQADRLAENRTALEMARDILKEVTDEYHRNVVPELNQAVSSGMKFITAGKYDQVRIDPTDLSVNLLIPETDRLGGAEYLSLGTQEQVYLLLRIGLSRLIGSGAEAVPILLDDPFVHFDQARLAHVLSFLIRVSEENQIFLFTKDPFVVEWFEFQMAKGDYELITLTPSGSQP